MAKLSIQFERKTQHKYTQNFSCYTLRNTIYTDLGQYADFTEILAGSCWLTLPAIMQTIAPENFAKHSHFDRSVFSSITDAFRQGALCFINNVW